MNKPKAGTPDMSAANTDRELWREREGDYPAQPEGTEKLGTCDPKFCEWANVLHLRKSTCVNWREQPAQGEPCTIETFNESSPGTIKPEPVTVSVPAQPEGGEKPRISLSEAVYRTGGLSGPSQHALGVRLGHIKPESSVEPKMTTNEDDAPPSSPSAAEGMTAREFCGKIIRPSPTVSYNCTKRKGHKGACKLTVVGNCGEVRQA